MGNCGASKGEEKKELAEEITFKECYVFSLDEFFGTVRELVNSFRDVSKPMEDAMTELYDITKFYEVPGASKYSYPIF